MNISISYAARSLVVISTLLAGISFVLGGATMNPERFVALTVCPLAVAITFAIAPTGLINAIRRPTTVMFLLWGFILFVSTALSARPSISGLVISVLPLFTYLLFAAAPDNPLLLRRLVGPVLFITSLAAIWVYLLSVSSAAASVADLMDRGRIRLWTPEANIYGSTLAALILLFMPHVRAAPHHVALLVLSIFALLLSFSKVPVAAFLIGLMFYSYYSRLINVKTLIAASALALPLTASFLILNVSSISEAYTLLFDRPDAVRARLLNLRFAWESFTSNPILGNGALSYQFRADGILRSLGSTNVHNLWIWQMMLAIAHDSGVVGVVVYLGFIGSALVIAFRNAPRSKERASYLAALMTVLVASQATTLHFASIFALIVGLACSRVSQPISIPSGAGPPRPDRRHKANRRPSN